jgi:hypothetical protein
MACFRQFLERYASGAHTTKERTTVSHYARRSATVEGSCAWKCPGGFGILHPVDVEERDFGRQASQVVRLALVNWLLEHCG